VPPVSAQDKAREEVIGMAKCVVCHGSGKCPACKGSIQKMGKCSCNFGKCPRCKGSGNER